MYTPYLRGKQFELISLRELTGQLWGENILPIVEPVRISTNSLFRAIDILSASNDKLVIIANPSVGEILPGKLTADFNTELLAKVNGNTNVIIGAMINNLSTPASIASLIGFYPNNEVAFVHRDVNEGLNFNSLYSPTSKHFFIEGEHSDAYRRSVLGGLKSLVRDAFTQRNNADHPFTEFFHDLPSNIREFGCDSFGDFTILTKAFRDGGGQPYCVAVHIAYQQVGGAANPVHMYHFKSAAQTTPGDPGPKSMDALSQMVNHLAANPLTFEGVGMRDLRASHAGGNFRGLGKQKSFQIIHHIETLGTVA